MRSLNRLTIIFGMALLLVVSVAAVAPATASSAADAAFRARKIIARWQTRNIEQLRAAHARGVDVLEEHPDLRRGYFKILTSADELAELRTEGYEIEIENYDWYATYAAGAQVPNGGFRSYNQCVALMDSIHTEHPSITTDKLFTGITHEGRIMWAMKISDNPDIDEDEPEVLFTGMHHAREPIGMEICLETMNRLTDGYGVDTFLTRLVNEREIYFMPVLNPDGWEYNLYLEPNGGALWRKNRSENYDGSRGVDLNRNYGYEWGYDDDGSSPFPDEPTYRGEVPFSEPETQAVRGLVNAHEFIIMVNYHSHSNLYLWPWGYDYIYTPDDALFSALGDSLSTFNGYFPTVGWGLYPTNGDSDDWAYGATTEHPKIYSYTPEVGEWFWPDPSEIPVQVEENQEPNFTFIEFAETPERIFPPVLPTWTMADTFYSGDYELTWSDPGGLNGAVQFKLEELIGPSELTDDAESGPVDWDVSGFTQVNVRWVSGSHSYFGGYANNLRSRMVTKEFREVQPGDVFQAEIWYEIEDGWDYAYVEASTDFGATFETLEGNITTQYDPHGNNRGHGITGTSEGQFVTATFDLSDYVGEYVLIRLSYETDGGVLEEGVYFDDIGPIQTYASIVTLSEGSPDMSYQVLGAGAGDHLYRLQSKDNEGQTSPPMTPKLVFAFFAVNGDMDNDSFINVIDLSLLIDFVFSDGPGPVIPGAAECNGVAGINVLDIIQLIDYIYRGGSAPVGLP
jgi:hypothetical protein